MKNFIASTTINFEGSKFYVRPGDILTHDAQHGNSLAVYRNGELKRVLTVDSLAIEAFLKSKFITEVRQQPVICKHCLVPTSKVLMADGTEKNIEDIKIGDWVITHVSGIKPPVSPEEQESYPVSTTPIITPETLADAYVKTLDTIPQTDDELLQYKRQKRKRAVPEEITIPEELNEAPFSEMSPPLNPLPES